jgi:hypothetical protein
VKIKINGQVSGASYFYKSKRIALVGMLLSGKALGWQVMSSSPAPEKGKLHE